MKTSWLPAIALLAGSVCAQTSKTIPAAAAAGGGNALSHPPFVVDAGLTQWVVDGSAVAAGSASITQVALRAPKGGSATRGRKIASLRVRAGYSPRGPGTMSTSFAANRTAAPSLVFSGAYVLPAQSASAGPGPFNLAFKFARAFAYKRSLGNLLVELEMPGKATTKFWYPVDAWVSGTSGSHSGFGTKGSFRSGDRFNMFSQLDQLRPGGEAILNVVLLKSAYPAFAIYGLSSKRFDLGPFGAAGNSLYVSLDLVVPAPTRRIAASLYSARAVLPIPPVASFQGGTFYGQCFFVDPPSNGLGLVFSNATRMTLGSGAAAPLQALHALDTSTPYGGFVFPGRSGGPVLQLTVR